MLARPRILPCSSASLLPPTGNGGSGCRAHLSSALEQFIRREQRAQLAHARDESGPPSLVTRAEPRPVVTVKVLVEEDVIAPMRIGLERLYSGVHRPAPGGVAQEDAEQASIE